MLIRSQDKKNLVRFENLYIEPNQKQTKSGWETTGYGIKTFIGGAFGINLGNYSTEEKAIKVLDMIGAEYRKTTGLEHEFNTNILFCVPRSVVFQMPQDSEV